MQRYVSIELTHFVGKNKSEEDQYLILIKILKEGLLSPHPDNPLCFGNISIDLGQKISDNKMFNPDMVCFCDIPVDDLSIHVKKYSPFGISFLKSFLIRQGANPVHYIAADSHALQIREGAFDDSDFHGSKIIENGPVAIFSDEKRAEHFDKMIQIYSKHFDPRRLFARKMQEDMITWNKLKQFFDFYIFSYMKFFNSSLSQDDPENWYMEREWRVLSNVKFKIHDVERIILPKSYAERFRKDVPGYIGQITFSAITIA